MYIFVIYIYIYMCMCVYIYTHTLTLCTHIFIRIYRDPLCHLDEVRWLSGVTWPQLSNLVCPELGPLQIPSLAPPLSLSFSRSLRPSPQFGPFGIRVYNVSLVCVFFRFSSFRWRRCNCLVRHLALYVMHAYITAHILHTYTIAKKHININLL